MAQIRVYSAPPHNLPPHLAQYVRVPTPVVLHQPGTNMGLYLRQNIVYLYQIVEGLSQTYHFWNTTLTQQFNGAANDQSRQIFWQQALPSMRQEIPTLQNICLEIKKAMDYLLRLHARHNPCRSQQHLQRRCAFLLELCAYAIVDSRVTTGRGEFYWIITVYHADHDNRKQVPFHEFTQVNNAYLSGLFQQNDLNRYTCYVYMVMPHQFNQPSKLRMRLPRHFVDLIQGKFGNNFRISVSVFRTLLLRYALFLAILMWSPLWHTPMMNVWNNFEAVLDLPQVLPAPHILNAGLPFPQNFGPNFANSVNADDVNQISGAVWRFHPQQATAGVCSRDMVEIPETLQQYDILLGVLRAWDNRRKQETKDGLFLNLGG